MAVTYRAGVAALFFDPPIVLTECREHVTADVEWEEAGEYGLSSMASRMQGRITGLWDAINRDGAAAHGDGAGAHGDGAGPPARGPSCPAL